MSLDAANPAMSCDLAEILPDEPAPVVPVPVTAAPARPALDPRTRRLLEAPIAVTLLRLAWPNVAVMLVQASTGLIET